MQEKSARREDFDKMKQILTSLYSPTIQLIVIFGIRYLEGAVYLYLVTAKRLLFFSVKMVI